MTSDVARKEELAQARATASQIRQGIHNYLATLALIARANKEQHWRVLGYESWQEYVDGEFGAERLRLPAEHRQKAVTELRLAGLSQRAIGAVLGVDQATVHRDLQRGDANASPEEITGTDGKTYAASRPSQPSATAEADGQLDAPVRTGEREAPAEVAPSAEAAETAVEVSSGTSAEASGEELAFGGSDRPAAAPAPAVEDPAGAGVNPSDLVNKVLDALVPDDNPHREWQRRFLSDIHAVHRLLRHDVDVVAAQADSQCIDEMGRIFTQVDEYRSKVLAALKASLPDNVTQLRRSS